MPRTTSTTCAPSSPEARCGGPAAMASTMSCSPMPRASAPPRDAYGTSSHPPPALEAHAARRTRSGRAAAARPRCRGSRRRRCTGPGASKLATRFASARRSRAASRPSCASAWMAVKRSPTRGPISIVRSSAARRGEARDALDRAEQRHDRGQVVRAHVEQRAGAVGVEDVGVRVPGLLPADEHGGADRQRLADRAARRSPRGRPGRRSRGRCRARSRCAGPRRSASRSERERIGDLGRQRLLGVDVLAGRERLRR